MKKLNFKKISNKAKLITAVSVIAVGAAGTAYGVQSNQSNETPTVTKSIASEATGNTSATPTQTTTNTATTANPVETTPDPDPTPTPPTNPYQEGFNIWHVYNRRIATGKPMPTDIGGSENIYCTQIAKQSGYTTSKTPTPYAIACLSQTLGFVEKVNADGSIVVSYTNFGQGWNKYMEVTYQPSEFGTFRTFIQ